jgi:hypothetical protein
MSAEPDEDIRERYRSYQYRKMMGLSVEQYEATPALAVDWDMQFAAVDVRVEETLNERARR